MGNAQCKKINVSETHTADVHPAINSITDALTFKIARLAALNERSGVHYFRSEHGITVNQWRILGLTFALGPVSSREVRDMLYMDKGQFSRVVKQLVELGYVRAITDANDARVIALSVTHQGKKVHDKLLDFISERNESVVSVLTPDDCQEFLRLLDKINTHNEALLKNTGVIT